MARSTSRQHAERRGGDRPPVADTPARRPHELTPVLASVLDQPIPFEGSDGRTHLVYELQLTNSRRVT